LGFCCFNPNADIFIGSADTANGGSFVDKPLTQALAKD
jgi:hypothetical protein